MSATQKVERAAAREAAALRDLHAAIREARQAGVSLRAVAEAAGVSYETVRRICS